MASGQINHMGFPGYVILYDFAERREIVRHNLHKVCRHFCFKTIRIIILFCVIFKVRVQSICFSAQDKYMISAGGRDDGTVIVFDIETL